MRKKTKWILFAVISVIIIGGLVLWSKSGPGTENLQKDTAEKTELKKTISVTGSLVSESPIALNFENSGRVQDIRFEIGDKVIEGDVVAVLDNNVLSEQVKKAEAALEKAKMDSKMNDDSTREASNQVDNAEDYLDAVEEYHDQLVEAAEVAYQNAKDYQNDAESYYDQIVADSGASSSEAKSAKLTLTSATNAEEAAEEALETTRKNRSLSVVSAENSLDATEEKLETVESDYAESGRNALVEAAEADYQIALKSLENSSLRTPLNGVISKINYEEGEVIGSASLGSAFGEMITKDYVLEADIPESDISDMKLGQKAEVTFDAFDFDQKFEATVIEIEPASTIIQDVVYYKTKLKLEDTDNGFKEGMSADIDIVVSSRDNAVVISDQFVFEEGGRETVYVLQDDQLVSREVRTGLKGDAGYVEVISGISPGEEVYLKED